jgi:predicted restriction endonuclease
MNNKTNQYKQECQVCGIEGTETNEHSVCEWSFLRTHHWKRVRIE